MLFILLYSVASGFCNGRFLSIYFLPIASQNQPIPRHPAGMILTSESCLRGLQGELILLIGDSPRPVIPPVWQSSGAGRIEFATTEAGCRFSGSVYQNIIRAGTETIAVGILSVTATNISQTEIKPIFWTAWREALLANEGKRNDPGILLTPFGMEDNFTKAEPGNWNSTSSWFFRDRAFIENQNILYWISTISAWEMENWVQPLCIPYQEITENSIWGYIRFSGKLRTNQYDILQIVVPYTPLSVKQLKYLQKEFPE